MRNDGGEDDSQADKKRACDDQDEDRKQDVLHERMREWMLERDGDHSGEQGDAKGGFGVEETDGVLGVFNGPMQEAQPTVKVGVAVLHLCNNLIAGH